MEPQRGKGREKASKRATEDARLFQGTIRQWQKPRDRINEEAKGGQREDSQGSIGRSCVSVFKLGEGKATGVDENREKDAETRLQANGRESVEEKGKRKEKDRKESR